jgi:segregation and condensation protein A|tara:strand:+ start:1702 stop:2532 length:831 start_codon:yes stop_codon:yes gene_type:complete
LLEDKQADSKKAELQFNKDQVNFDVDLAVFKGPLNLLLYVIERNELNVLDVPIVHIVKSYITYLENFSVVELQEVSKFLLVCSRLMLLKSRNILPKEFVQNIDELDSMELNTELNNLTNALNEIKNYQEIIHDLKELENIGHSHYRENIYSKSNNFQESLDGISLDQLSDLFNQAIISIKDNRTDNGDINFVEEVSFTGRMDAFAKTLNEKGSLDFFDYIVQAKSLEQVIVDFLCILTFIKIGYIQVIQQNKFGPILINKINDIDEMKLSSIITDF